MKKLLLAAGIGALVVGIPLMILCFSSGRRARKSENELNRYKNQMESARSVEAYIVRNDIAEGQKITEADLDSVVLSVEDGQKVIGEKKENLVGKYARMKIFKGCILTENLCKNGEKITKDMRIQDFSYITLPEYIKDGDYVDIRIVFPNGEDYLVAHHKKVIGDGDDLMLGYSEISENSGLTGESEGSGNSESTENHGNAGSTEPTGNRGNSGNSESTGNHGNSESTGNYENPGNSESTGSHGNSESTGNYETPGNSESTGNHGNPGNSESTGNHESPGNFENSSMNVQSSGKHQERVARFCVSEEEILRLASAYVDNIYYEGTTIYVNKYVDSLQESGETNYPVNPHVFRLLGWDPNLWESKISELEKKQRSILEKHLKKFLSEKENKNHRNISEDSSYEDEYDEEMADFIREMEKDSEEESDTVVEETTKEESGAVTGTENEMPDGASEGASEGAEVVSGSIVTNSVIETNQ